MEVHRTNFSLPGSTWIPYLFRQYGPYCSQPV